MSGGEGRYPRATSSPYPLHHTKCTKHCLPTCIPQDECESHALYLHIPRGTILIPSRPNSLLTLTKYYSAVMMWTCVCKCASCTTERTSQNTSVTKWSHTSGFLVAEGTCMVFLKCIYIWYIYRNFLILILLSVHYSNKNGHF